MGSRNRRVAALFLAAALTSSAAGAQERAPSPLVISPHVIQQGIESAQPLSPRPFATPRHRASSASTRQRVIWTSVGAAAGFFAGGAIGASIENAVSPCGCDDPGLKGALIGMPIGAVLGGVTGWLLAN
jgi:hypothetical protein